MKKSIKIPRRRVERDCLTCANMIPVGEGDHICSIDPIHYVLIDYTPTKHYCSCGGEDWEEL